jgi:hypothetical protein
MNNLLPNVEFVVVEAAASAAQTELVTDTIDMAGWTGVVFVAALGDVTTGSVLGFKAMHSDDDDSNFADLDGALAFTAGGSDADNKLMILDVVRPEKRYLRASLTRTSANAIVSGIYAIKYEGPHVPITQGDTVLKSAVLANPKAAA